jgi:hypothetical protein
MRAPAFEIEITSQGWLGAHDPDLTYDPARVDVCSHGTLRLTIGSQLISAGSEPEEYGISESALALLRTLESDHSPAAPVAERLVFHGCGVILMMGCPVGIDWSVSHHGGQVRIQDVVRYDSVDEGEAVRFRDLTAELSEDDYRRQIVAFAVRAKEPFEGVDKVIDDDWERGQYEEFWAEFDARLGRAEGALT